MGSNLEQFDQKTKLLRLISTLPATAAPCLFYECIICIYKIGVNKKGETESASGLLSANIYVPILSQSCQIDITSEDQKQILGRRYSDLRKYNMKLISKGERWHKRKSLYLILSRLVKYIHLTLQTDHQSGSEHTNLDHSEYQKRLTATIHSTPISTWYGSYKAISKRNIQ